MQARPEELQREIRKLDAEIAEQRLRLPPHSVRPAMLLELEEMEARRDRLRAELCRCPDSGS